jgi:hypothetical protein
MLPVCSVKHHFALCLFEFAYSKYFLGVESYSVCPCVNGLFHLAQCLQRLSTL